MRSKKTELLSIILFSNAFIVFSIIIPVFQTKIDSNNSYYSDYIFNLQQCKMEYSEFIKLSDCIDILNILSESNIIPRKNNYAVSDLKKLINYRRHEHIAFATFLAGVDPGDKSDNAVSRLIKYKKMEIDDLLKIFDGYNKPSPTDIGHKYVITRNKLELYRSIFYGIGGLLFILGTILQLISKKN